MTEFKELYLVESPLLAVPDVVTRAKRFELTGFAFDTIEEAEHFAGVSGEGIPVYRLTQCKE